MPARNGTGEPSHRAGRAVSSPPHSSGWPLTLSRRGLLGGGAALAAGALAAGCAPESSGGSGIDEFTAVIQGAGAGEGIDPGINHLFIDEARHKALYDGLFEVDDRMRPVPRLATGAEPTADATRWRIELRDARWHDGRAFTADDVLFTLSRILGPARDRPFIAAKTLGHVDLRHCKAIGRHAVEIALRQPSFDFLSALASYGTRIVPDGTTDFTKPVGTGPFRFASFEPGRQLVATANADYWDGAPKIARLSILSVDADARLTAIQGGQADFADGLTASATRTLRGAKDVTVHDTHDAGVYYFAAKTDRPPFDDVDVRRALMHLADRRELVKVALQGKADVGNDVFGHGYRYYADLPQHSYDPDKAAALLRRAGADGLSFRLFTAPAAIGLVEAAQLFARQARKAGVHVEVATGAKDTYYTEALRTDALTMGQSGPIPIPNHFAERLVSGAPQNRTMFADARFDQLYAKAQRTADDGKRADVYRSMHEICHDHGGFVFWAYPYHSVAARSEYRHVPTGVPNSLRWMRFDKVSR